MTKTYEPSKDGAFLIAISGDLIVVSVEKKSGRLELPGGGKEEVDQDLLGTALRETWEEAETIVDRDDCELVGTFIQRVPRENPKRLIEGYVEVWTTQVFDVGENKWSNNSHLVSTDGLPVSNTETFSVHLLSLKSIFAADSPFVMPLGHKRMLLHYLNKRDRGMSIKDMRFSEPVTAHVPGLGLVTY